jgi:hypothetical protein
MTVLRCYEAGLPTHTKNGNIYIPGVPVVNGLSIF